MTPPSTYRDAIRFMASHSGPVVLVSLMMVCGTLTRILGSWAWQQWGLIVLVFMLRGIIEWGVHRYLMHEQRLPLLAVRIRNPIARMHRIHHGNPDDADSILFSGRSNFIGALLVFLVVLIATRDLSSALASVISMASMFLAYEWCHLLSHTGIIPQFRPFRAIILNHRQHHFADGEKRFGVSSTIGDKLFGTDGEDTACAYYAQF